MHALPTFLSKCVQGASLLVYYNGKKSYVAMRALIDLEEVTPQKPVIITVNKSIKPTVL